MHHLMLSTSPGIYALSEKYISFSKIMNILLLFVIQLLRTRKIEKNIELEDLNGLSCILIVVNMVYVQYVSFISYVEILIGQIQALNIMLILSLSLSLSLFSLIVHSSIRHYIKYSHYSLIARNTQMWFIRILYLGS